MRSEEVLFRPATQDDLVAYYGKRPEMSVKGFAAVCGGTVVGVGGLYVEQGNTVAFCEIKEPFNRNKKALAKGCRILMQLIDGVPGPVYAVADKQHKTSGYILAKLGWKPTGVFNEHGETLVRY